MAKGNPMKRRRFLQCCGGLATAGGGLYPTLLMAAKIHNGHPLAPKPTHFEPKAKRLLFIFLTGGFSHLDTFDPKPKLRSDHGKEVRAESLRAAQQLPLLGSPFEFKACGQSGLVISELFPRLQEVADDLCVIRTMHTDIVEHFQATLAMHTGSATVPMPSLGSWLSYGLGTFNPNLPSFMVLAEKTPYAGSQVWDSSFLPPYHQAVRIIPGDDPVPDLRSPQSASLAELESRMLRDVNELHADLRSEDLNLRARMNSFEVARGMMREAPAVFDVSEEADGILELYGVERGDNRSFAFQCLVARRLMEKGVRVVELIDTGSKDNWDAHDDILQHRSKAARVDQAITALIEDLKRRGLFEETLIVCCTEFGRTPWVNNLGGTGRNHWAKAFTCLLAGAGVKGGIAYGETDDYGENIVSNPVHVHDYHATILHLMGLDHTKLTYRYGGRDFRLTDVGGQVLQDILT